MLGASLFLALTVLAVSANRTQQTPGICAFLGKVSDECAFVRNLFLNYSTNLPATLQKIQCGIQCHDEVNPTKNFFSSLSIAVD